VVLAASQRPSMPALRELLALGRQHKIGIIALDYGIQWAAASERFIHPGKRDCGGGRERGALVPPVLSHGGHRHDISGLKELAFWTCPLPSPLAIPSYPLPFEPPPFFSRPCQLGCSAWPGELGPLPLFARETKTLRRKREEAESFTWYQPRAGMVASAFPSQAPLLAERCWCDPSTPFSPSVPLTPPRNPFFSALLSILKILSSLRAPFQ